MSGQLSIFRFSISGRSWSVWTASAFISASSRKHGKADRQHKHKTIFREGIFMRLQDNAAFAPLRCVLAGFFKSASHAPSRSVSAWAECCSLHLEFPDGGSANDGFQSAESFRRYRVSVYIGAVGSPFHPEPSCRTSTYCSRDLENTISKLRIWRIVYGVIVGTDVRTFCHLEQDAKTDVLIIGGGIAGVLCAYLLHQAGVLYLLLEAETIGGGITKNTTAKITSQHGLIYSRLIQSFGEETARRYAKANQDAVRAYQDLIDVQGISCDWEERCAYLYGPDVTVLQEEAEAARRLGLPASFTREVSIPTMGRSALKGRHSSTH